MVVTAPPSLLIPGIGRGKQRAFTLDECPPPQECHRGRETLDREDLTTMDDRRPSGLYDSAVKTGESQH